ncbi:MAG TPA: N-formylglutamate deformylase [Usitatibacter sp.]|nr:N-formylglutamate deformylase [Usitatibacter sp.]
MFLSERTVPPYRYRRGTSALIVSMPHVGTFIPHSVGASLSDCAARRPDTDWHLPRLYDFLEELGATVVAATHSRYVVDVNRPPDGANLYPGQDTPRLCPVDTFHSEPLYRDGTEPSRDEIERRLRAVWLPYHRRLAQEVERVRSDHGAALLWDAHSIASEVPRLFDGRLPDFNLGTADGKSCDPALAASLLDALSRHRGYTAVLNGRFKGGYITRQFGVPANGVHAIQLEMAESVYMDEESPYAFRPELAARVRPILREQLEIAKDWVNRSAARRV